MLACKTPKSIIQGDIFYSFEAISYDDGTCSIEAHEWYVRSCQKRKTYVSECGAKVRSYRREGVFVNIISKKNDITWVNGGWASYIAKDYQIKFEVNERLPDGIYTTKQQAIKYAVKKWSADIEWYVAEIASLKTKQEIECYEEDLLCLRKEIKLLKSRLTRIRNLNKLAKAA